MTPLGAADILPLEAYREVRDELRRAILAHKATRRIAVGDRVTLLFEDRETIRWQIQEMCRVEGLRRAEAIEHEIAVYNELIPGERELSATLFVEITDVAEIRPELDRLIGIDEHVTLWIGDEEVRARFDPKQMEEDRISAVQYVRFGLTPLQASRFGDPSVPLRIRIDHPRYLREAEIPEPTRRSLEVDLHGDPAPLIGTSNPPSPSEPVVAERGRVRAIRPARPCAPGHLVVEAVAGPARFDEADPELLLEVLTLARELGRDVLRRHGSCRISFDPAAPGVRCDVHAAGR